MLAVMPVAEDKQEQDPGRQPLGTGRLQTVQAETNPRYHKLISQFDEQTGVPVS